MLSWASGGLGLASLNQKLPKEVEFLKRDFKFRGVTGERQILECCRRLSAACPPPLQSHSDTLASGIGKTTPAGTDAELAQKKMKKNYSYHSQEAGIKKQNVSC